MHRILPIGSSAAAKVVNIFIMTGFVDIRMNLDQRVRASLRRWRRWAGMVCEGRHLAHSPEDGFGKPGMP